MSLVKYNRKTKQEQIQYTKPTSFVRLALNSYSIEQGAHEYTEYLELQRSEREFKEWQRQQKQEKKQKLLDAIAEAQNLEGNDVYTVNDLYEAAIDKRTEGDGLTAAKYFWTSLICGEARSAYPLFEMLWNGESGVGRNPEIASMILFIGRNYRDSKCSSIPNKENTPFNVADEIFSICAESRRFFVNNNQKITNDIADLQVAKAEEILDGYSDQLRTRAYEEPMVLVFAHSDYTEETNEIELSGNNSSHDHGSKCVIM